MRAGRDVKKVRDAMGLDPFAFAAILGVHVSTIYRWEGGSSQMDPLQGSLVEALYKHLDHKEKLADLGEKIRTKLTASGGTFVGLHTVLTFLINE